MRDFAHRCRAPAPGRGARTAVTVAPGHDPDCRRPNRSRARCEAGAASIEGALLIPAALLIIFVIIQAALWWHGRDVALHAAQDGVRTATADGGSRGDGAAATTEFIDRAGGASVLSEVTVTVTRTGDQIHVTVRGRAPSLLPGVRIPMVVETAAGPVEQWTAR